jgi:small GTP-binding protein
VNGAWPRGPRQRAAPQSALTSGHTRRGWPVTRTLLVPSMAATRSFTGGVAAAARRRLSTSPRPAWTQRQPQRRGPTLTAAGESALTVRHEAFESPRAARTLRCCLVGPTNAGKSTMLNRLVNSNVSIVSDKIHTTRENTVGFMTDTQIPHRPTQVEFIDAPGALGPHVPLLQRAMWEAVRSTDLALVVVDAADQRLRALSRFLSQLGEVLDSQEADGERRTETVLVLNKVDKVRPKARLLPLSEQLHEWHRCATPAEPRPGVR